MGIEYIILVLALLVMSAALPFWPYSRKWGYGPSCLIGIVVLIFVVMVFLVHPQFYILIIKRLFHSFRRKALSNSTEGFFHSLKTIVYRIYQKITNRTFASICKSSTCSTLFYPQPYPQALWVTLRFNLSLLQIMKYIHYDFINFLLQSTSLICSKNQLRTT